MQSYLQRQSVSAREVRAGLGRKLKVAIRPRAFKVEVHQNLGLQVEAESQDEQTVGLGLHCAKHQLAWQENSIR